MMKKAFFENEKKKNQELYNEQKKQYDILATLRGISFIVFILFLVLLIIFRYLIFLIFMILPLIIFIVLIIIHEKVSQKKDYYFYKIMVINDYLSRVNEENNGDIHWKESLTESGYYNGKDKRDQALYDLDIFGSPSLYSFLCVARTKGAKKKLGLQLSNNELSENELLETQEAVKEISSDIEASWDFQAKSHRVGNNFLPLGIDDEALKQIKPYFLGFGLLLTISLIILFIIACFNIISYKLLVIPLVLQFTNTLIFNYCYNKILDTTTNTMNMCETLHDTFESLNRTKVYQAKKLKNIQKNINDSLDGLKKISTLCALDTFRSNYITYILTNVLFPLTCLITTLYNRSIKKNIEIIKKGNNAYEELEVLMSLSIIGQVRDNICMPIRTKKIAIDVCNITHPLINESTVVANDFQTATGVNVITGSNMSGKTSFMKTIGINLVLMNAGTFVCAQSFSAPYLKIFTSMKITDDITKGISTFYAELLRIREAVEYHKTNQNMITLIDEVFKGTNSNDRIKGAIALIRKLNSSKDNKTNSIVFITTHDFEICDIDEENLFNYNFSEYYIGNEIKFTYKINKGKCQTTNARFLMKLAGIID